MYTIKRAAELTGVPVATLRAWERRYGVIRPHRTDSGYRLYDEPSLAAASAMRELIDAGWSAGQAAAEVRANRGPVAYHAAEPPATAPQPAAASGAGADATTGAGADAGAVRAGDGAARLIEAAARLDAAAVATILDEEFSRGSFEAVVDGWLMPALVALGEAWADRRVTVAGEHLVANAVQRRLAAAFDAAARPPHHAGLVVGLPAGARHELGILAFATAARRAGIHVTYLGADLPAPEWPVAVLRHGAVAAALAAPRRRDLPALAEAVAALHQAHPGLRIAVGGRFQHLAPAPATPLGHRIGPAAAALARDLRAGEPGAADLRAGEPGAGEPGAGGSG